MARAAAIASASHAALDLVLVRQPVPFWVSADAPWTEAQASEEESYLASMAAELASVERVPTTHAVMLGEPVTAICRRARDVAAEIVVMTSRGRTGLGRAWLGSVAHGVVQHAATPVLMLRPMADTTDRSAAPPRFKRILVPLDGSAFAMEIIAPVLGIAQCTGARILLLRVVPSVPSRTRDTGAARAHPPTVQDEVATRHLVDDARQHLAEAARRLAEQDGVDVQCQVVVGAHAAESIIDVAHAVGADAIAMATHGRGASRLLVGSVADGVLRASGLPMLVCRPVALREDPALMSTESLVEQLPALSRG